MGKNGASESLAQAGSKGSHMLSFSHRQKIAVSENEGFCLMAVEFQFGKLKKFWRWMVVMFA